MVSQEIIASCGGDVGAGEDDDDDAGGDADLWAAFETCASLELSS